MPSAPAGAVAGFRGEGVLCSTVDIFKYFSNDKTFEQQRSGN